MYLQPTNCLQATFSRLFVENRCVKMVFFGALPSKQTHQNPTRKIILPTLLGVVRWEVTLPETNGFVSENRPKPKRKGSFSNHPFSEAKMLVSGRVIFVCFFFFRSWTIPCLHCAVEVSNRRVKPQAKAPPIPPIMSWDLKLADSCPTKFQWIILVLVIGGGWLYATYHLLQEPEESVENSLKQ